MDYVEVSVSPAGEIVLPEGWRKSLRVEALVREHGAAGASVSEELIAERRADALRE